MSGQIYGPLPELFKDDLKPLGTSAESYIKRFMLETMDDKDGKLMLKIKQKPLMVDTIAKIKIKKKNRVTGLSAKQKRELGFYKIQKDKQKFKDFVPLNKLWIDYMKMLLGPSSQPSFKIKSLENKLLKADYHGAFLKVVKSKCETYIGTSGIVVQETKNMFYLITEEDRVKGIPKNGTLFEFEFDGYSFEIFGSNFRFRSSERSARKFKTKPFMSL